MRYDGLCLFIIYSHLSNKCGGWNKRGGGVKVVKSLNMEVGKKRGGWDFLEKLVHNSNKQGEINKRGGWNFSKSVSVTSRLLER